MRVYSDDIKASGGSMPDQNVISGMSVKSSGAYTSVSLEMDQKVPYKVAYDGSQIIFKFDYTARTPDSDSIKSNALFKSAKWEGSNLNLTLRKAGGFLGYKAYYEGNSLVLRFNNSPGSLSGARIVVDPGHGGNDPETSASTPARTRRTSTSRWPKSSSATSRARRDGADGRARLDDGHPHGAARRLQRAGAR